MRLANPCATEYCWPWLSQPQTRKEKDNNFCLADDKFMYGSSIPYHKIVKYTDITFGNTRGRICAEPSFQLGPARTQQKTSALGKPERRAIYSAERQTRDASEPKWQYPAESWEFCAVWDHVWLQSIQKQQLLYGFLCIWCASTLSINPQNFRLIAHAITRIIRILRLPYSNAIK